MGKTIIKEIGIILLLLVAIVLVLGIIFYDYIPNNKTVPAKVSAYAFPEEIRAELQENVKGEQNIVKTYYIDSDDLSLYEATKDYNKGRVNPFATTNSGSTTGSSTSTGSSKTTGTTNTNTTNTNTTSNTNTTTNNNTASGEYYNNKAGKY